MSSSTVGSPCMSDAAILMSVEDLINIAMGPLDGNTVDFKMVQTILHLLARQMRMLDQKVLLATEDFPPKDLRGMGVGPAFGSDISTDGSGRGGKGYGRSKSSARDLAGDDDRLSYSTPSDGGSAGRGGKSRDEIERDRGRGRDGTGRDKGKRAVSEGQRRGSTERVGKRQGNKVERGTQCEEDEFESRDEDKRGDRDGGRRERKARGGRDDREHGGRDGADSVGHDRKKRGGQGEKDHGVRDGKDGGRRDRKELEDRDEGGRRGRDESEQRSRDDRERGSRVGRSRERKERGSRDDDRERGGRDEAELRSRDDRDHGGSDEGSSERKERGVSDDDRERGGRHEAEPRSRDDRKSGGHDGGSHERKEKGGHDDDRERERRDEAEPRSRAESGHGGRDGGSSERKGREGRAEERDFATQYDPTDFGGKEGGGRDEGRRGKLGERDHGGKVIGDDGKSTGYDGKTRGGRDDDDSRSRDDDDGGLRDDRKRGGREGGREDGRDGGRDAGRDVGKVGGLGGKEHGGADDRDGGSRGGQEREGTDDRDRGGRGGQDRWGADKDGGGRGGQERGGTDDRDRGSRGGQDRGGADKDGGGRGGQERGGTDDRDRGGRGGQGRGGADKDGGGRGGQERGGTDDRDRGGRGGQDHGGAEKDGGGRGGQDRGGADKDGGSRGGQERGGADDRDRGGHGGQDSKVGGFGGKERGGADDRDREGRGGQDRDGDKKNTQVSEIHGPGKDKLLVVKKSSTNASELGGKGSIAVVTQSRFRLLEKNIEELQKKAGHRPPLVMPDNKQLRKDLADGASLTDTMQAMQVSARMNAAEQAIKNLSDMLTTLASSGALPPDAADSLKLLHEDHDQAHTKKAHKAVKADASVSAHASMATSTMSKASMDHKSKKITENDLELAFQELQEEMNKLIQTQVAPAATNALIAKRNADTMSSKLEDLLKMDSRILYMQSMVDDCAEHLDNFDECLATQMHSFKQQMSTMRAGLTGGLQQLEVATSNAETAAVMELNERYEMLVRALDDALLQQSALTTTQDNLLLELKELAESIETLREQKADRGELMDGLRDKADNWRMKGLVKQAEFQKAREDLQHRMTECLNKFDQQDIVWRGAISDLNAVADKKASYVDLLKLRDEATEDLRRLDEKTRKLALILGEPKTAMLMRQLSRGAYCASCLVPALMNLGEEPAPPLLPALRPPELEYCTPQPCAPSQPDMRKHKCQRWVGGSHTLLAPQRGHPRSLDLPDVVTDKYADYGSDGRLYRLEKERKPCVEYHNEPLAAEIVVSGAGAGDSENVCKCEIVCKCADAPAKPADTAKPADDGDDICDCEFLH